MGKRRVIPGVLAAAAVLSAAGWAYGQGAAPVVPPPPSGAAAVQGNGDANFEYGIIELTGDFGEEIIAPGIDEALKIARKAGLKHIVIVLDSNGGIVEDAKAIAQTLQKHQKDGMVYHLLLRKGLSASVWIMSLCSDIMVGEKATAGAAVAFSIKFDTGSAAVDQKFLSAVAAEIAGTAEANGQSPLIYRAMVRPEDTLYYRKGNGKPELSTAGATAEWELIDGPSTILTMTPGEMVKIGFARRTAKDNPRELGRELKITGYKPSPVDLQSAVKAAVKRNAQLKAQLDGHALRLERLLKQINELGEDYQRQAKSGGGQLEALYTRRRALRRLEELLKSFTEANNAYLSTVKQTRDYRRITPMAEFDRYPLKYVLKDIQAEIRELSRQIDQNGG